MDFYGGSNTAGWQHEVAGEHGMPTYGAFNVAEVMRSVTDIPEYRKVVIDGEHLADCVNEHEVRSRLESLLSLAGNPGKHWLGGDLGYTSDPTELLLFEEDENEVLTLALRVHAERVAYPMISEMIALIDQVYNPVGIGIDRGGNGMAVEHELLHLDKYRAHCFVGRLAAYDFGGMITVGEDANLQPIRKRTKEQMTIETAGKETGACKRVFVDGNGEPLYAARIVEIVYGPDGLENERREPKSYSSNLLDPRAWSGKLLSRKLAARRFAFTRKYMVRHVDALTFDFLFALASNLESKESLVVIGSGVKGVGPLILERNGAPMLGLLEGRTDDDGYLMILHLAAFELRQPPENTP